MKGITDSQFAMYEGMIALSDHELEEPEKQLLHSLIDSNLHIKDAQRQALHYQVDAKVTSPNIWPRTTHEDRTSLLDMAHDMFAQDGEYEELEKQTYDAFLAKHMATIDSEQVIKEMRELAVDLYGKQAQEDIELKEYVRKYSLLGCLRRYF